MKEIYNLLQKDLVTFILCLIFISSPFVPEFLQENYGTELVRTYLVAHIIVSTLVFIHGALWLKTPWKFKESGYMMALTFGSFFGLLVGISAVTSSYSLTATDAFFMTMTREIPIIFIPLIIISLMINFLPSKEK